MTAFSTLATELTNRFGTPASENTGTSLCWLTHEGVIAVDGPDAERFLQGQLTCDVTRLGSDETACSRVSAFSAAKAVIYSA